MDEKGTVITVEDLLNGKYRYVEGRPVRRSYVDMEEKYSDKEKLEILKGFIKKIYPDSIDTSGEDSADSDSEIDLWELL